MPEKHMVYVGHDEKGLIPIQREVSYCEETSAFIFKQDDLVRAMYISSLFGMTYSSHTDDIFYAPVTIITSGDENESEEINTLFVLDEASEEEFSIVSTSKVLMNSDAYTIPASKWAEILFDGYLAVMGEDDSEDIPADDLYEMSCTFLASFFADISEYTPFHIVGIGGMFVFPDRSQLIVESDGLLTSYNEMTLEDEDFIHDEDTEPEYVEPEIPKNIPKDADLTDVLIFPTHRTKREK